MDLCWRCGSELKHCSQSSGTRAVQPAASPVLICRWLMLATTLMWLAAALLPPSRWRFQLFVLPNPAILIIAYAALARSRVALTFGIFNLIVGPAMVLLAWLTLSRDLYAITPSTSDFSRWYAAGMALITMPVAIWFFMRTKNRNRR